MKKVRTYVKTIALSALIILFLAPTAFADSNTHVVETNFFGNFKDDGEGCGIYTILNLVLDILSIGVGLLGVMGISIVGTQYLTAKGNEEQARKSRRRFLEVVAGLASYALLYAGSQWLLPGGKLNISSSCSTVSNSELENEQVPNSPGANQNNHSSSHSSSQNSSNLQEWYQAMNWTANYMKNAQYGSNYKSNFAQAKYRGTCITYPSVALQKLGVIPKNKYIWYRCGMSGTAAKYIKKNKSVFSVSYPNKTAKQLNKQGKIKKGDIVFYQYGSTCGVGHTMIFVGFKNGKPRFNTFGHAGMRKNVTHGDGNKKIKMLIHLKKTRL